MTGHRTFTRFPLWIVLGAGVALAACGGAQSEPASPQPAPTGTVTPDGTAAPPPADAPQAAPEKWSDDLTKEQKAAFMKAKVVPTMSKVFQDFDDKEFAGFGCKTCHGPDWKSPKDYLPKLHMKDGQIEEFKDEPEEAKFMAEKVVPAMAGVFGMQPFDPATKQGFGCMGCHTVEMQ